MLALGAAHVALPGRGLRLAQLTYARITGAGGSFAFFSPNVPREVDVTFDVERADGTVVHTSLLELFAPEVRTRLGNMIRLLGNNFKDAQAVRSIAAALSVNLFRIYPDARSVTLHAFLYDLPPLCEFKGAGGIKLVPVYTATFRKAGGT